MSLTSRPPPPGTSPRSVSQQLHTATRLSRVPLLPPAIVLGWITRCWCVYWCDWAAAAAAAAATTDNCLSNVAGIIVPIATGVIQQHFGWNWVWRVAAVISGLALVVPTTPAAL